MPVPEVLNGRRVVASSGALDSATWPQNSIVLRVAPDEALVVGDGELVLSDPYALLEDDASLAAIELTLSEPRDVLARLGDWEWASSGESLSQGLIAGIPAKVWTGSGRVMLIVPTSYLHEAEERLR